MQSTAAIQFACYLAARSHGATQSAASYVIGYSEGFDCCHLRIHLRRSTCFGILVFSWTTTTFLDYFLEFDWTNCVYKLDEFCKVKGDYLIKIFLKSEVNLKIIRFSCALLSTQEIVFS